MKLNIGHKKALEAMQSRYKKAEEILKDDAKMEPFLAKLEQKIARIPFVREEIKAIPILIAMVRSYWKGDYRKVPTKTIIAIISALLYFLSPIDVVPDWIPFLGQLDDVIVIGTCWKLVHNDIDAYRKWKQER
ncbi:uncharacterized membrane protein YkvA (DUF1232 family) [Streptococcus rupicaprae]|uniref:Uncharacterized membrane protein YkvA (DUF1232 family) n=1 Tax=Streptococcus rupicaprae TaxID=759619 RepID=A0ABV2FHI5_9STRE